MAIPMNFVLISCHYTNNIDKTGYRRRQRFIKNNTKKFCMGNSGNIYLGFKPDKLYNYGFKIDKVKPLTLTLKNLTKSPKYAAPCVVQSPYPIYSHGKACLSKQLPWRAAGDPRLSRGRSQVWVSAPAGALCIFLHPPFLLWEFFHTFPTTPIN